MKEARNDDQTRAAAFGIGAGPATSGQVLVFHDLLGITGGRLAKFVKPYEDIRGRMIAAVSAYADEVRAGTFPGPEHVYSIDPSEVAELNDYLDQESLISKSAWEWEPLP